MAESFECQISIIIPVYNTAQYLEECLDSVILHQELERYEIIIVNDGSTDSSKEIIKKYCSKYEFIKCFDQQNMGQGKARNLALLHAIGKYVYFMDSDDYLSNNKLSDMLKIISSNNLDALFFDGKSFRDKSKMDSYEKFDYERSQEYGLFNSGEELLSALTKKNELLISPCLYISRLDIIRDNNIMFPEGIKHEDEYFTATLFLYIEKCKHVKENVFMRRIRENSTMTNMNKKPSFIGYSIVLVEFFKIYESHFFNTKVGKKAYEKKIKQLIKSAYRTYQQIDDKEKVYSYYSDLNKLVRSKKSFYYKTWIYVKITNNKKILERYNQVVSSIKKLNWRM